MTAEIGCSAPTMSELADQLIATAARAPSVHNTQPWRFRVNADSIDLYADQHRKLRVDPVGREMLISCGAALFGLRLAIRSAGYLPVLRLLPDRRQLRLLATVELGAPRPATPAERQLLEALPHRHTHRGPFEPEPLPAGLMAALQHDALNEGAWLFPVDRAAHYHRLADLMRSVGRRQDASPQARADIRQWTRAPASSRRDGVPAHAFAASASWSPGRLRQRDFDQGRGMGLLTDGGPGPACTAVLLTLADGRADWLRAGEALHRVLLHAASQWVFASIYTQPLEAAVVRDMIRKELGLPGVAQLILQFGVARTAQATARRPPSELVEQ